MDRFFFNLPYLGVHSGRRNVFSRRNSGDEPNQSTQTAYYVQFSRVETTS